MTIAHWFSVGVVAAIAAAEIARAFYTSGKDGE